jgi:hypothetical protein
MIKTSVSGGRRASQTDGTPRQFTLSPAEVPPPSPSLTGKRSHSGAAIANSSSATGLSSAATNTSVPPPPTGNSAYASPLSGPVSPGFSSSAIGAPLSRGSSQGNPVSFRHSILGIPAAPPAQGTHFNAAYDAHTGGTVMLSQHTSPAVGSHSHVGLSLSPMVGSSAAAGGSTGVPDLNLSGGLALPPGFNANAFASLSRLAFTNSLNSNASNFNSAQQQSPRPQPPPPGPAS